jgi:TPR repeat protein
LSATKNASTCTECSDKLPERSITALELDKAAKLYDSNQKEEAIEIWRKGATEENARAMYNLGFVAENRKDYKTAAMWYERSAEKGYLHAMAELARLHYDRLLPESDRTTAIMWYERYYEDALRKYGDDPTKIDDAFLIAKIAWMIENGIVGAIRNPRKAYVWYKAASDLGNQFAQQKLSELAIYTDAQPETNRGIEDVVVGISLSQVLQKCSPINYTQFRCRNRPELFGFFVDDGPFPVALGKPGPSIWTDGYGNRLDSDNTFVQKISVNAGKHLIHNQSKDSKYNQILSILQNKYEQNYRYSQSDYFEALSTLTGKLYYLFDNGTVALLLENYFGNNEQFDVIIEYRSDVLGRLLFSKYVSSSSPKDY